VYFPSFEARDFVPFLIFSIPIIAIAGGITAGIVRTIGQQRLAELVQRERIAAIERGVDLSKLPPPPGMPDEAGYPASSGEQARRLSQNLMIGGLVLTASGFSLGIFLQMVSGEDNLWTIGLIPGSIGVALLVSSFLVRPTYVERRTPPSMHQG
jgi:hypothetical protein